MVERSLVKRMCAGSSPAVPAIEARVVESVQALDCKSGDAGSIPASGSMMRCGVAKLERRRTLNSESAGSTLLVSLRAKHLPERSFWRQKHARTCLHNQRKYMVAYPKWTRGWIVTPVQTGSSPVSHPRTMCGDGSSKDGASGYEPEG